MGIRPIMAVFNEIAPELGVTLPVHLGFSKVLPDFIREGMANGRQKDTALMTQVLQNLEYLTGVYSPGVSDDMRVIAHHIWVKEQRDLMEMSVAFAHELVHASQVEAFGLQRYIAMDEKFNEALGYEGNPFEIEAEALAQFTCRQMKVFLFEFNEEA